MHRTVTPHLAGFAIVASGPAVTAAAQQAVTAAAQQAIATPAQPTPPVTTRPHRNRAR